MKNTRLIKFPAGSLDMAKLDANKQQLVKMMERTGSLKLRKAYADIVELIETIQAQEMEVVDKLLSHTPCQHNLPQPLDDIREAFFKSGEMTEQQKEDVKAYARSIWYDQSALAECNLQYLIQCFPDLMAHMHPKTEAQDTTTLIFHHPELTQDWQTGVYTTSSQLGLDNIGRTQIEPEQWELIIRDKELNEPYEYLYDTEAEAYADWETLKNHTS